jgi:Na+/proline symporter
MGFFNGIDYTLMGVYVFVLVGLGLYLQKRASASLEDYILGGRTIPWWAIGISGMASWLDLTGTAVIVSFLYMLGPRGLFIEFRGGAVLILPFMMLWMGKWHRRSGCLTGGEYNIFRFGDTFGGRFAQLMAVIGAVVGTVGMLAYMIIGVGSFLAMFLPFSPMMCSLILVGVATLYTMVSGFYGVIFTDIFQSGIIVAAVIYMTILAFGAFPDMETLQSTAFAVTGNPNWCDALPSWEVKMPAGYEVYRHIIFFACFYLLRNVIGGLGSGADPKYFGARSDQECGKLSILWTFLMTFRWPLMMGIAVLGVQLVGDLLPDQNSVLLASQKIREFFPDVPKQGWGALISGLINNPQLYPAELISSLQEILGADAFQQKLQLIGFEGGVNPEKILPAVLLMKIGQGFRGLMIIALIAASMSTFDTTVNMSAGLITNDLYKKYIRPKAKDGELIYVTWGVIILLVGLGFWFAYNVKSINDIWGWIIMCLTSGGLAAGVLRYYWWRFNGMGFAAGSVVGMIMAVVMRIFWPGMNEVAMFILTLIIPALGCIAGTYLSPPVADDVLKEFYVKTRPFGLWGHLKSALPEPQRLAVTREHARDVSALPFALTWQVCMFIAPMMFVVHNMKAFWISLACSAVGLFGVWFLWMRHGFGTESNAEFT